MPPCWPQLQARRSPTSWRGLAFIYHFGHFGRRYAMIYGETPLPTLACGESNHHGCGLSFDVTTKSVLPVPHRLHRNRRWTSGTSLRPCSTSALGRVVAGAR
jgi:hypothetical protein